MSQLVEKGDLFFDGSIQWNTHEVVGNARIYKFDCDPLEYQVKGILSGQQNAIGALELKGWAPTYRGCNFDEFVWDHNSRLTFEPLYANLPPSSPPVVAVPPPLGWVDARYVDCGNSGCFIGVPADGANIRTYPNGHAFLALVNGTPLAVLQRQGRWVLVAATCNLVRTGLRSDTTQGVPLDTCR